MRHTSPTTQSLRLVFTLLIVFASTAIGTAAVKEWKSGIVWPRPPVVDPGPADKTMGSPPSDAIVLFDGKDLSQWNGGDRWIVKDGVATVSGRRSISTKKSFGDCQIHVEWAAPTKITKSGQRRGNSGVYIMGKYEVQILDSYKNKTYYDGQAGAIYKQSPPMVNACRPPGQWQTFDIVFRAPRFNKDGSLRSPAAMTVIHNGITIQNNVELLGPTTYIKPPKYEAHPAKLPLLLQCHRNPVRFRNIWIRNLKPLVGKKPGKKQIKTEAQPVAVSGTLTLDGKPLAAAVISFQKGNEKPISAKTNDKGFFKLKAPKPGVYNIKIKPSKDSTKTIPKKFSRVETSTLMLEVSRPTNNVQISLSSK